MRTSLLFILFILPFVGWSQTCCSAGAQVSSIYSIQNEGEESLAINFAYEYSNINLLIDQNERLVNDPRTRFGQNVRAKIDYALNKRLSFSATLPFVHQSRRTVSSSEQSIGIGDALILGQYAIVSKKSYQVSLSSGIKLPTGNTNQRNQGIFLSPDMQSGSGTIDYFFLFSANKSNFLSPFGALSFQAYYRNNGVNDNFARTENFDGRRFGFGDEWSAIATYQYTFIRPKAFLSPDINLKIRSAQANIELQTLAPNLSLIHI